MLDKSKLLCYLMYATHLNIARIRGNTIVKNVFSLPLYGQMCSDIERYVFARLLMGRAFFVKKIFYRA